MIEVFCYELPHRKGVLLRCDTTDNWSEISPLPGYSKETLEDVLAAVFDRDFDRYPSVAFGIDMLLADITPQSMPCATLLMGPPTHITNPLMKIKMKGHSFEQALQFLPPLIDQGYQLRLDFNQSWTLEDALKLSHAFDPNTFEYFEEPTKELAKFCEKTTQPVAVDESLLQSVNIWDLPNIATIVLKPTLFGSVGDCLKLAQTAKQTGKQIVLSSSYETGVGLTNLIKLAHLLPKPIAPLGIGTYQLPDVLQTPLYFSDGMCHPSPLIINSQYLERLGVVSFDAILQ